MRQTLLALAALGSAVLVQPSLADVIIGEKDSGTTVRVPLGEPLVVKLRGKHDSGYYWRLDADLTPQLILSGRTTSALDEPGAPETTTFTFETDAPGRVEFRASELRAGAPIPDDDSDVVIRIDVQP